MDKSTNNINNINDINDNLINPNDQRQNHKALFTMFFTILLSMMGIGILIPVYPLLILPNSPFQIIPSNWSLNQGFIMLGWLSACFPITQFLFAPIFGQLSDKLGRRKILAISIIFTAVSYFLFAIGIHSKNLPLLFFARILDGAGGGNIAIASAVIADISLPANRAKNFGLIGMSFGLGFILGPFIGGKLADPHFLSFCTAATPFYFAGILGILNLAFVLKVLPETLKFKSNKKFDITQPIKNIMSAITTPKIKDVMPSVFLTNTGFAFFTVFFGIVLAHKFQFNQSQIGNYFAYLGLMIIIMQGVLIRRISKTAKDFHVLRYSMFGTALCLAIYFFIPASHPHLLYFIPPFMCACNAMTNAFNSTLITRITHENMRGESFGINSSVMALSQAIPAILSGYIATISSSVPTLVGSITVLLGGIMFWKLFKPEQHA